MNLSFYQALARLEDLVTRRSVARHLAQLKRLRYADPEYLHDYQLDALQRLLRHAYKNVFYYKEKFDAQGIHPEDIKSFKDFAKIPPLTREDVKNNCEDIISKAQKKSTLKNGYTSGSSGTPMIYYYDRESYSAGRAAVLSGWEMAGKKLGDRLVTVWGSRDIVEKDWPKPGSRLKARLFRNKRIPGYLLSDENNIRDALDIMLGCKGGYVFGYTNALYTLASYAKDHNILFDSKFDGILTTAENLFPHQRSIIEDVLGPIYDGYGCQEILGIAFQCQEQKGYHVVEPNVILETEGIIDDTKEIIVTDLWNYAWPLIRYKPGDLVYGELSRDCPCKCSWRTFERIDGRSTDIINAPDGTIIYYVIWLVASTVLDNHPYIKQFQWVKVADNKLILKILAHKKCDDSIRNHIKSDLMDYLKGRMEVDVEFVDMFEIGPSGKHKVVVDMIK